MAAHLVFAPGILGAAELGIGLVSVKFDDKTVIEFYERPFEKAPVRVVRFFDDKAIKSWNIVDLESVQKWLAPESLWLDYHSFVLRCRSRRPGWRQVIVNNYTGEAYWVRNSPTLKFITWERFLSEMFAITRSDSFPQKLYSQPTTRSREIKLMGEDCFQLVEMRGDWIRIKNADHCEGARVELRPVWLRWRRGDRLLIDYFGTS